jgi:hypothetical protein
MVTRTYRISAFYISGLLNEVDAVRYWSVFATVIGPACNRHRLVLKKLSRRNSRRQFSHEVVSIILACGQQKKQFKKPNPEESGDGKPRVYI